MTISVIRLWLDSYPWFSRPTQLWLNAFESESSQIWLTIYDSSTTLAASMSEPYATGIALVNHIHANNYIDTYARADCPIVT